MIYFGDTAYPITEGLTYGQFKQQHAEEFSEMDYEIPMILTKKPFTNLADVNISTFYNGETINYDGFESDKPIYYLTMYLTQEDFLTQEFKIFDDLVLYFIPKIEENATGDGIKPIDLNKTFDFDNCAIIGLCEKSNQTNAGFVKYPYNATKIYEPYFYNVEHHIDGKSLDEFSAMNIFLVSPKNLQGVYDSTNSYFVLNTICQMPINKNHKFYINYNTTDSISATIDGKQNAFTIPQIFSNITNYGVLDIDTAYEDTDIFVFKDKELTYKEIKDMINNL